MTAVAAPAAAAPGTTPAAAPVEPAAVTPPASPPPVVPPVTPPVVAEPVVPESYTLTLPEKSLFEPTVVARLTPVLKDLKVLDNATGQKVLDALHAEATEVLRVYEAARAHGGEYHKAMVAGYTADAKADAFLGNGSDDALNALSQQAGELLAHYGPEYAERLKATGEAVHPAFLKMMKRLHADFGEKASARGAHVVDTGPKSWESQMYPGGIPLDTGIATTGKP